MSDGLFEGCKVSGKHIEGEGSESEGMGYGNDRLNSEKSSAN